MKQVVKILRECKKLFCLGLQRDARSRMKFDRIYTTLEARKEIVDSNIVQVYIVNSVESGKKDIYSTRIIV